MTAFYRLIISNIITGHDTTEYPSNWDQGVGMAATYAADNSYRMEIKHNDPHKAAWWFVCPTMGLAGYGTLERFE